MAVEHVKSTNVTNADAVPVVANTTGMGSVAYLKHVSGLVVAPASASIDSTFRFVRVPTDAIIKTVCITSAAQAAGAIDIGVYYPTTGKTGLPDLAANAISQSFFASAYALTSASGITDVTFEAGAGYTRDEWNMPLWQALGLSADPGGYFDIVGTLTTAITTGLGVIGVAVELVV